MNSKNIPTAFPSGINPLRPAYNDVETAYRLAWVRGFSSPGGHTFDTFSTPGSMMKIRARLYAFAKTWAERLRNQSGIYADPELLDALMDTELVICGPTAFRIQPRSTTAAFVEFAEALGENTIRELAARQSQAAVAEHSSRQTITPMDDFPATPDEVKALGAENKFF